MRCERPLAITSGSRSSTSRPPRAPGRNAAIEPEEVFSSLGNWYVVAWDVEADAERLFRADRVIEVAPTGVTFDPRGLEGAGRALYTPTGDDVPVRLRLRPSARWIAEYYATTTPSSSRTACSR